MKERILKAYGYSLGSWRNFATSDRRGKSVPTMYRLQILLGQMDEEKIERVFDDVPTGRGISIQQPFVEKILSGKKRYEYRSRPTKIRERVYLYASLRSG